MVRGYDGFSWQLKPCREPRPGWNHDHCAACSGKLMQGADRDADAEGYAGGPEHPQGEDYEWLCADCAQQRAVRMHWNLRRGPPRE